MLHLKRSRGLLPISEVCSLPIPWLCFFTMAKRLSKNFLDHEFQCPCGCPPAAMDPKQIDLLQKLRDTLGEGLRVTSGIRCVSHNAKVGGAKRSWHIPRDGICYASDITFLSGSKSPKRILKLYVLADRLHFKGLGLYRTWIHADSRGGRRARWIDHHWNWRNS